MYIPIKNAIFAQYFPSHPLGECLFYMKNKATSKRERDCSIIQPGESGFVKQ